MTDDARNTSEPKPLLTKCPTCHGTGWALGLRCWCAIAIVTITKGELGKRPFSWKEEAPNGPLRKGVLDFIKGSPLDFTQVALLKNYVCQFWLGLMAMDKAEHGVLSEAEWAAKYPDWEVKLANIEDGDGLRDFLRWAAPFDPWGKDADKVT